MTKTMASNGFMGFWTRFLSLTNCGRHNELQVISEDYPPIFSDLKILKTSSVSKNSQWFSFRENRNPFKNSGLYLLLVGVVFYTMMACSPLYADDYHDFFLWGTSHRLTTFRDYFHNLYLHYFHESARLIPHCFVELFGVFLGKDVFNVLNTVVFLFFLFLLTKYSITLSPNKESVFPLALCLATCLIFLLMPGFSHVFLWVCGACNYLWPSVLLLGFLILMENNETKLSPVGMLLLGIICGWTNEALVFGLAVGLFLHFLFHRQELTRQRALLLLGFIIGFLFLALSPASINRFQVGISSSSSIWKDIFHRLVSALLAMENIRLLPLLMLLLLVFAGFRQIPNQYFKENDVLFYATGFSLFLVLATNHFSAHSRFGIELFSLILILRLVSPFLSKKSSVFIILFIGCFLCIAAPTVHFSYLNQKEYKRVIQQIQRRDSFIIQMEEVQIPKIYERLVLRFMPSEKSDYYHGFLGDPWIENYFGKRTLCFLPKRFLEASHKDSSFQEFDVHTDLPFYAKTITPDISIQEIKLILAPTNPKAVPLALRPFMNKFERWSVREIDVDRWRVLTLPQGQTFLLVGQNSMVHNRVSSIVVK